MTATVPHRSEVAVEHTWDAYSVYESDAAWDEAINRLQADLDTLVTYRGRLQEGPEVTLEALRRSEEAGIESYRIYTYAMMFYEVDSTDQEAASKQNRARSVYGKTAATASFIEPELIEIGFATLREWAASNADLAIYNHYFAMLERKQAHVRSAEVEEILGLTIDPFMTAQATHGIIADADMQFAPAVGSDGANHEITQGTIGALISDADREVRRTAWENYADSHLALKNTMANCLAAGIKHNVFNMRARRYESSLEASLSDDFIPTEVFHQLLSVCQKNLPLWHRYWRVRRKALGYDKLHVYDIKAPLTKDKVDVSFQQAMDWIIAGMEPMGSEYIEPMRNGVFNQRWVDIYPNKGKRAGAFSAGVIGTHPFILMNFNDDVYGMSTLAHELGHSMHSYFAWQNQPLVYSNYTIFVAEVASNFNQALVRDYLFKTVDDPQFQIALIEEAMSNFHRYFFIMPTLARFELELHQRTERGEALTAESLNTLMADLFREGYGDEVEFDADRIGITWAQFPTHLYSNFYVYQYATGIAGAQALAKGVLEGQPSARDNYMNFLKAGSSLYPLDALKLAGVDLTAAEPVEEAYKVLGDLVDRLEKLVG